MSSYCLPFLIHVLDIYIYHIYKVSSYCLPLLTYYIWKAHNDNRFQRRTWTPHHIRQAATAHMHTHLDALNNPNNCILDNPQYSPNNISAGTRTANHQMNSVTDRHLVHFPTSISRIRCYTDASTQPDSTASTPRQACLGIFIINTNMQPP